MNKLEVSEIQIIPVKPKDGLVAFASCIVNQAIYLGNIAIYTCPSSEVSYRLVYPTKKLCNDLQVSIVYPIKRSVGQFFQTEIVREYLKIIENVAKGVVENGRYQKNP